MRQKNSPESAETADEVDQYIAQFPQDVRANPRNDTQG